MSVSTWRNSTAGWGRMARLLHWGVALLILGLLAVGFIMVRLDPSPTTIRIYTAHKSIGLLLLAIVLVRIAWRSVDRAPPDLPMPRWQAGLARVVHFALYGLLLAMPLSGWLLHSASGYPLRWFFAGPRVPALIERSAEAKARFGFWHEALAWVLVVVLLLHVAGALKHHFIDRDRTLWRMWRGH